MRSRDLAASSVIPVALQLYSVREETQQDFARTVAAVAEMGYTGVELAGYGNLDARRASLALKDAGLLTASMHVGRDALRKHFRQVVDEAFLLGTSHVVCPFWPAEEFVSVGAVEQIGRELATFGERLREEALLFSFHNHASEFRPLEGRAIFSWMLGAVPPCNLSAELDVYWAHTANYAPERFLYEQGERVRLLHLKDEKVLGRGPVNFDSLFTAAEKIGSVEWYIVEQEVFDEPPLVSVRHGLEQLRRWGKV